MFEENYRTNAAYFRAIKKAKPLPQNEENKLIRMAQTGDKKARNLLVKSHMRFVVSVSYRYRDRGMPLADLISEGGLGLIRAVEDFDEVKHFRFLSYAVWWIRQSILKALNDKSRIIRIPSSRLAQIHKKMPIYERMMQTKSRTPIHEELAGALGIHEKDVTKMVFVSRGPKSIESKVNGKEGGILRDVIPDGNTEGPDKNVERKELVREIKNITGILKKNEQYVIRSYFGFGCTEKTMNEICDEMGLSLERVRQIKYKALDRLRHPCRIGRLKEHVKC